MAETYKILGQTSPLAATETALYVVPAATAAVISTVVVCNRGVAATFRVSISPSGAATDPKDFLYYDLPIVDNDTFAATFGLTLSATDVVRVYSSSTDLSFNIFGTERT